MTNPLEGINELITKARSHKQHINDLTQQLQVHIATAQRQTEAIKQEVDEEKKQLERARFAIELVVDENMHPVEAMMVVDDRMHTREAAQMKRAQTLANQQMMNQALQAYLPQSQGLGQQIGNNILGQITGGITP